MLRIWACRPARPPLSISRALSTYYRLDYNYNAPYFGAFAANHAAQSASFWQPILDWMAPARIKAQAQAALANVSCPANALYFACHLAPWGLMSLDPMTRKLRRRTRVQAHRLGDEFGRRYSSWQRCP